MPLYNTNVRLCATCAYWVGNRKAANLGNGSEVENGADGNCQQPTKRNIPTKEYVSCHYWQKWPALR